MRRTPFDFKRRTERLEALALDIRTAAEHREKLWDQYVASQP